MEFFKRFFKRSSSDLNPKCDAVRDIQREKNIERDNHILNMKRFEDEINIKPHIGYNGNISSKSYMNEYHSPNYSNYNSMDLNLFPVFFSNF
jgi:hypothetical protein